LSLDDLYFSKKTLLETAQELYKKGLKLLILDEVHKYPNWHLEIKNLHDRYADLQIIFTGSSIIDISKSIGDLSRRALMYELVGLSYREYLWMVHDMKFPAMSLSELLSGKQNIMDAFPKNFLPYRYWDTYLSNGYYPFSMQDEVHFHRRLRQIVRMIVEYDMAELKGFDIRHAKKMLQLIVVLAQQVPFKPNIVKLAEKTNLHRNSILSYFHYLQEARLIDQLYPQGTSIATLQKSEKIYIDNTNLLFALSEKSPNPGSVRETFVNNQLRVKHRLTIPVKGDFAVDDAIVFEVGGKSKTQKQIQHLASAYIIKDGLDYPIGNAIPIWMLGFLY
jgi:predicted AAA+ superfamily ATPase